MSKLSEWIANEMLNNEKAALEMAQLGKMNEYYLFIYPNDNGNIPHLHFFTVDHKKEGCIKLETAEYFPRGRYKATLTNSGAKDFAKFMASPYPKYPNATNYEMALIFWNANDERKQVPLSTPIPDYTKLNEN